MKLPPAWNLPAAIKHRLGQKSAGKQRVMRADGHLLLVLHQAPQIHQTDRIGVFIWRRPNGSWEHSNGGVGFQVVMKHLRTYDDAEALLVQQYNQAQTAADYFRLLEAIAPLRLATQNLHTTLQAAREGIPSDRDIIDARDWAYELERSLDLLQEHTKNALDFRLAQRAEEQTQLSLQAVKTGHRLNVLAAIFFPLTAVSCVFGMNLTSGLEGTSPATFWVTLGLAIALGFWVQRWSIAGSWQ